MIRSYGCLGVCVALALVGCGESPDPAAPAAALDAGDAMVSQPGDCDAGAVDGIEVAQGDPDGYPSYALSGCKLLYVAAASAELIERDLSSGAERVLESAALSPRRPSAAGEVFAWEIREAGLSQVRVAYRGVITTLSGSFAQAGEARAASDAVVFTGFASSDPASDADVYLYDPEQQSLTLALGGSGQQRFADISPDKLVASDFSEDPSGVYSVSEPSLADLVILDRRSGDITRLVREGKQAFAMLGLPGRIAFLDWIEVHPMPKLEAFSVRVAELDALDDSTLVADVSSEPPVVRPIATDTTIEWVQRGDLAGLYRAAADSSSPPGVVPGLSGLELSAPIAGPKATLLAVRGGSGKPVLKAVAR